MSKIYEALQRAEAERAAGIAVQDETSEDQPASRREQAMRTAIALEMPPVSVEPVEPQVTDGPAQGHAHPVELYAEAHFMDETSSIATAPSPAVQVDLDAVPASLWKPMLECLPALQERGPAVEQFRSLRSRLFEFRDLNRLKSVMVSSGLPQEGKSFVAANLAISFARHKASRVLLIDGDMRRSSLHKLLGCEQAPGLTSYLSGHSTMTEILQRPMAVEGGAPVAEGLASLTFIGGGNEGDQAADLSGNMRFKDLLTALDPYFDWIVVDSSPVNLIADGVNLARACDGVLLIARGGVTPYTVAQKALAELKAAQVLGVVLNAVADAHSGSYYGYGNYDSK